MFSKDIHLEKDLQLFVSVKNGDSLAFEDIYNKYCPSLFKNAYSLLKDKEKCQDIIQNVFTDLWRRKSELEIQNVQAYLYTAVRFQTLKAISQNKQQSVFIEAFENEILSPLKTDGAILEKEARHLVELFIKALPAKRQKIFLLHYFDELSTADIASKLNISQKTVQNQLTTASQALRLRLTQLFNCAFFIASFFF